MRLCRWKPPRRNVAIQNASKRDSRDSVSCTATSNEDNGNKRSSSKRHSERLPLQRVYEVSNYLIIHNSVRIFRCFLVASKAMRLLARYILVNYFIHFSIH